MIINHKKIFQKKSQIVHFVLKKTINLQHNKDVLGSTFIILSEKWCFQN